MKPPRFLARPRLTALINALGAAGYLPVGPQVRDGAIVYEPLHGAEDLPRGIRDEQAPGRYRVSDNHGERHFAFACGPQALKPLVFAGRERLWSARRDDSGLSFSAHTQAPIPSAIIGVRACDLAALALHDSHFLDGPHEDPAYRARRAALFLVAVNCSHAADTCFCASTGDGPAAQSGYDLLLDELDAGYLIRAGSDGGAALLEKLPTQPATQEQIAKAEAQVRAAAAAQTRRLPGRDLKANLFANLQHPRWQEVAARCLSCGNCTAVCPTCFCHAHVETPTLDGTASDHSRVWDSCFTEGHSYMHGFIVRGDTTLRYRQWLTHKLGTWHDQYGRSGCVGCGRCIAWCPAGIDLTEEATAIVGNLP